MKEPSKIYFKNKTPSPGGGSITEIYSEVLAQVCLAFAIVKNRPMHWSDVVIGGDDPSLTSRGSIPLFAIAYPSVAAHVNNLEPV